MVDRHDVRFPGVMFVLLAIAAPTASGCSENIGAGVTADAGDNIDAGGADGFGPDGGPGELNATDRAQLAQSRLAWEAVKARPTTSYSYGDLRFHPPFGGYSSTTIDVVNDQVVRRSYSGEEGWVEDGTSIGTHQGTDAAEPLTIDGVYDACASNILTKDPATNSITVAFENDGVLSACVYRAKNCFDDCDIGYRITSLTLL